MNLQLKPKEILFLWRLAVAGGGDWKKEIKPDLESPARKRLESAGLIEAENRKSPSGRGKPLFITLTDNGWGWLAENLDCDLNTTSSAGNGVLQRLLARLKVYTDRSQITLGELMLPAEKPREDGLPNLEDQIVRAYLAVSKEQTNVRVRLSDLRRALPSVPRTELNEALLGMASSGKASLYRLDNPAEIRAEDREAVLRTPSGEERHVVYLGGRGS
jgi:hypothetical protein